MTHVQERKPDIDPLRTLFRRCRGGIGYNTGSVSAAASMSTADEVVVIVDHNDRVVDRVPRHVMRAQGLRHRVTYILVFDSSGRLFVQKRTGTKDVYPGYYDLAAGGVVREDEDYDESAARELLEELGIGETPLVYHFKTYFEQGANRCWGKVYSCVHDGPFTLQKEEVEAGWFVDIERIRNGEIEPLTPDTRGALERYLADNG